MSRLEGKSALITGSARGIGKAFAARFAEEGAQVAIADINLAGAEAAASEIGPNAYAVQLDVTDQSSIDAAIAAVEQKTGGLDILVNNAALFDLAPIVEITRDSYQRLFDINVSGTLFMMQASAKSMIRRGQGGKIINMASQAGRRGEALVGIYCATKAAVISLTQSAGLNLIEHGINVNAIAPASSTASTGTMWIRCSRNTKACSPAKEGSGRSRGAFRPHGHRRRSHRHGRFPGVERRGLHRIADLQRRWRQLDELTNDPEPK